MQEQVANNARYNNRVCKAIAHKKASIIIAKMILAFAE
jgi:hypothetical protein